MLTHVVETATIFSDLPDPRRSTRNKLHKLADIVMIALCAILVGYEDWVSIEDFEYANETWLRGFFELPNRSGATSNLGENALYSLFELGKSERLQTAISVARSSHFQWKLTSSLAVYAGAAWQNLPERYMFLQKRVSQSPKTP